MTFELKLATIQKKQVEDKEQSKRRAKCKCSAMSKASWRKSKDLPGSTAQTEEETVQDRDGQWGKTDELYQWFEILCQEQ